jgi:hypothetical protein
MKKSELRQIIREEIKRIKENSSDPSWKDEVAFGDKKHPMYGPGRDQSQPKKPHWSQDEDPEEWEDEDTVRDRRAGRNYRSSRYDDRYSNY